MLPRDPAPADAQEVTLLGFDIGKEPVEGAAPKDEPPTWKEFVVNRHYKSVEVYLWIPHGRRIFRSLIFSSRGASALHNLELDTPHAKKLLGAAGDVGAMRPSGGSLVVLRTNRRFANLTEQYVSPRLLRGVLPSALLESYSFWDGWDGKLRGWPTSDESAWFSEPLEVEVEGSALRVRRGQFHAPGPERLVRPKREQPAEKKSKAAAPHYPPPDRDQRTSVR